MVLKGIAPFGECANLPRIAGLCACHSGLRIMAAEAGSEFRRLDMPARASEAAKVAVDITARRRSTSPLSAREEEVASLVAQALSNRQIADRLVLSERTVETHVRSILAKLNFTSRTEIAAWVLRTSPASPWTRT
jgi:DNA-binding NarL/FixJ family response regulator